MKKQSSQNSVDNNNSDNISSSSNKSNSNKSNSNKSNSNNSNSNKSSNDALDKFKYEEEIMKLWKDKDIYKKVQKRNEGSEVFNHVDGPPYPTGEPHLGHLRNWAIKDSVLRFHRFLGKEVYARDGYDVHGLPVENKVQAKLGLKTVDELKKFGEENFVSECKKYVKEITTSMTQVRERFGLWMSRDSYQTSNPEYLSFAWNFFKKAEEKGLLYKDYKTVAWCPHDETTLSDYEIKDTYTTLEDPSIYVKFPLQKSSRTTSYDESLVIWTTTPWTLQSNMAIAMNQGYKYSKVLVDLNGKKEVLILATSLVDNVLAILSKSNKIKLIEILETKVGVEFEGVKYDHIYLDETPEQQEFVKSDHKHIHSVVMADYVTLDEGEDVIDKIAKKGSYKHSNKKDTAKGKDAKVDVEQVLTKVNKVNKVAKKKVDENAPLVDGTGLVHIAPGHGFDDYEIGKKYNLPIFCPVGVNGCFTTGKYEGVYFKDVDPIAIEYLTKKGFMIHNSIKSHRYPCCWRCKTPIVYRAADQWWIKRSEMIPGMIKTNSNVKWYPSNARENFNNLLKNAGDWPISRQRYWGIPLPIFEDEDGNYEVFGSKEELEKRVGKTLVDIHRDDLKSLSFKNEKSGKIMRAVPFITDVWFESGCASFASHYGEGLSLDQIMKKYYPMKWITEGEDQMRGWFSSLFTVGYMMSGKAPYDEVLFQRFVMDKDGVKMSKSVGNGIEGNEAIERFGSDATRYYILSKRPPEEQVNFNLEEFSLVSGFFNTLENVIKYIKGYTGEYKLKYSSINFATLDIEDKWILYRLNRVVESYTRNFENYRINYAIRDVENFIVNDLSKTYLKLIKDRTETKDENLLVIFNEVVKKVLIMLAPAIPFKTEKLYQEFEFDVKFDSIFLESMPVCDRLIVKDIEKKKIDENFELVQNIIASVLNAREKAKIGVRWPLGQIDIISSEEISGELKIFEKLVCKLTNISKVNYDMGSVEIDYVVKPNFKTLKQDFDNIQEVIKTINMNKFEISGDLKAGETFGEYDGLKIDYDKHILKEIEIKGEAVSSDFNGGSVILHTHQDDVLLEEGYLRELFRRVQDIRKNLGLNKSDVIELSFDSSCEYFIKLVANWGSVISKKVGASEVRAKKDKKAESLEFDIKGKKLVVSVWR